MSGWITSNGPVEASNNTPENQERGPRVETSPHLEVQYKDGKARYIDNGSREVQLEQGRNTSSVLNSARNAGGGLIHGRSVRSDDQVMLPGGVPTSATVAADLGYLVRNADGTFSDVAGGTASAGAAGAETDDEEPASAEENFVISEEGKNAITQLAQLPDSGTAIRAMDEILNRGEVSDSTIARLASLSGSEPEDMTSTVNTVHQAFHDAASERLQQQGLVNEEAFASFVNDNPMVADKLFDGARALVMTNDTSAIDEVASRFAERADRYMPDEVKAALSQSGIDYQPDGKGGINIIEDGMPVPFQVAVRQGIIRVSGA